MTAPKDETPEEVAAVLFRIALSDAGGEMKVRYIAAALVAAYRAGQEAMRERAAALLSEWDCDCEFDDDRERCASCSVNIRALPIEDKP